jgi:penicillin amidase
MQTSAASPPAGSRARRLLRAAGLVVLAFVAALVVAAGYYYVQLRASLPQLEGERTMPGASGPVVIARDALGVPAIAAATRADAARGLGFVHAQDRFFQMDLARRRAAGELSELIGKATVATDTRTRALRFRARAEQALAVAAPGDRALVQAYADGVNAGLAALGASPPEYLALRVAPQPWKPEDSLLVGASMYLSLQDAEGTREARLATVYAALPPAVADFMTTTASDWETPLSGAGVAVPPIPDATVIDVRATSRAERRAPPVARATAEADPDALVRALFDAPRHDDARGSNNWAVAGRLAADGGAIVADDMHLGLSVPNIWYRAAIAWTDTRERRVAGATLPGVPTLIAGSNGDVAWGFTNTTADWSDLVEIELDATDPTRYRTPQGAQAFTLIRETVRVKGAADVAVEVRETIWGPVVTTAGTSPVRALAWVPLREGGLNLALAAAESAETLEQLYDLASRAGIPAQNLVAAQRDGRIGWSIAGRIPRRIGFDGRLPASWADGTKRWDGWLDTSEYPRIIDPPGGRIVTANNRLVDRAALAVLGDGGYDIGARARQIGSGLAAIERATVADMLRVQLDDRALFLDRWRGVLLDALTAAERTGRLTDARAEVRRVVTDTWSGHASTGSAAYRIVREFRTHVGELAFMPLLDRIRAIDPDDSPTAGRGGEGPLWALVSARPRHLLDAKFGDWEDLFLAAVDRVHESALAAGGLATYTWGRVNTARIKHPLSLAVPALGRFLDMPGDQLPGDSHMPRVQGPGFGASERFAVSPGREAQGYFHMPTGQSGHPLSPHYRDAHAAWVTGEPTPFLPGPPVHTLTLRPAP